MGRAPARWTEHRAARVAGYVLSWALYFVIIGGINLALLAAIDPSGESGG